MYSLLANRWRPAHAIERSASHRFGMTAHPVCPGGFSMTFRRIAVFCRSHASHSFFTPHPRESRASGEMIDDARRKATRRLLHLKCPPDGRARATRTHSRQPNRRRHARVTPAPADEGHGRAQHDGKEADERTAASVATVRVGDRRECLDDMHCRVTPYSLLLRSGAHDTKR